MLASSKKDSSSSSSIVMSLLLAGAVLSALLVDVESFSPPSCSTRTTTIVSSPSFLLARTQQQQQQHHQQRHFSTMLAAKSSSGEGGKKKRRRKRKKGEAEDAETAPAPAAAAAAAVASESLKAKSLPFAPPAPTESITVTNFEGEVEEISMEDIQGVAEFSFKGKTEVPVPPAQAAQDAAASPITPVSSSVQEVDGYIPLPDIRDTLRRKKMEVANKGGPGGPMENNMPKTKIDRNDRVALMKLLEQDPYADGDDSFFFEQEYTQISAWLGEGTKPFLGIPTGPLQVGHFIGSLVIVLMAFIEYPGFPLTNLPTPLRDALQGGLGTIYGINVLLCGVTFFKARARDQPILLWMAKTLSVGGLALDQLTQLPTTEEVEIAKARKGKRALPNRK